MHTTSFFLRDSNEPPINRMLNPFQRFFKEEASGGILLLVCTVIALAWANSPWSASYHNLFQTVLTLGVGDFVLSKGLILWINDGLMAVFFFVVGLEIKREVMVGELAQPRQAALPIAAAIGGMVFPALFFFLLNPAEPDVRGWGIPMATDIAFSLGVLSLIGRSVPISAKIFLTAFAIVDDIGASLVIAVFYTDEISLMSLAIGGVFLLFMIVANRLGIRRPIPYAILGFCLWVAFLKSGVHPTIAGILAALTIPASTRINTRSFLQSARVFITEFEKDCKEGETVLTSSRQRAALGALESAAEYAQTPLQRLEHELHPWVSFFIMPVFALANTGVSLGGGLGEALMSPVSIGVILGLVLGKQLGVTLFAWMAVKLGIAEKTADLTWRHIYGISWLGAIGFTMSLFIANLAYAGLEVLDSAKIGILAGSLIAGLGGWLILRPGSRKS